MDEQTQQAIAIVISAWFGFCLGVSFCIAIGQRLGWCKR
jgi:predicted MFS family arabinose efflux permease